MNEDVEKSQKSMEGPISFSFFSFGLFDATTILTRRFLSRLAFQVVQALLQRDHHQPAFQTEEAEEEKLD